MSVDIVLDAIRKNRDDVPAEISFFFTKGQWENLKIYIKSIPAHEQKDKLAKIMEKAEKDFFSSPDSKLPSDDRYKDIPKRSGSSASSVGSSSSSSSGSSSGPSVILHTGLPPMMVAHGPGGIGIGIPFASGIPIGLNGLPIGFGGVSVHGPTMTSYSTRNSPATGHLAPFPAMVDPFNPLPRLLPRFR